MERMGTNLFIEGSPAPLLVRVRLQREVTSFEEVTEVSSALSDLDRTLRTAWPRMWPSFKHRAKREVYLVTFRVQSPPEFMVFADPAWLAVFIGALAGYGEIRRNVPLIIEDVGRIVRGVRGLTERQTELLGIATRLSAERFLESGERSSVRVAKRFRRARQRLLGASEELPEIEIIDIVNRDKR